MLSITIVHTLDADTKAFLEKLVAPVAAPLTTMQSQLAEIQHNTETIMGTQAQDDANLAAGIAKIQADEAAIKQGVSDLATRVSNALKSSASASDPAVQQAIADLATLDAAMQGDATAIGAIAPASSSSSTPPASGETAVP